MNTIFEGVKSAIKIESTLLSMSRHEAFVAAIALSLHSDDESLQRRVLELLTVFTAYNVEGHSSALAAFGHVAREAPEPFKYARLVAVFSAEKTSMTVRSMAMLLITELLAVDDLEERIAIRADLLAAGLLPAIEVGVPHSH